MAPTTSPRRPSRLEVAPSRKPARNPSGPGSKTISTAISLSPISEDPVGLAPPDRRPTEASPRTALLNADRRATSTSLGVTTGGQYASTEDRRERNPIPTVPREELVWKRYICLIPPILVVVLMCIWLTYVICEKVDELIEDRAPVTAAPVKIDHKISASNMEEFLQLGRVKYGPPGSRP